MTKTSDANVEESPHIGVAMAWVIAIVIVIWGAIAVGIWVYTLWLLSARGG